ncbi:MAG: DUF2058 domain-containing protein [Gammaproteobacteria bacterium]|nr:DUF2058 domain-containing protein [Gammaproteobacteria bacterium]MBU1553782.1 DUF2058 domain-containing protein [Gammaproteobacteria bacterium]MBU2072378.1 DUF2058 domain-containing protein [Gammaproteobacteria bacterium]MBU2184902.1 DUF2058 domain-containing protein [Gammaproteobacteria bacterium]MBU2204438.1 DUF2058 domain-containing protein [Gammaproteobacteria bacterium]
MSNALKEQLLKAGLADAKKLKAVKKAKHQEKVQAGKNKAVVNEASLLAEQSRQQQVARDRELNQQKQAELQKKAIAAQVRQLINNNTIKAQGDVAYNFTDGKLVKRLYVNNKLHDELSRGLLAIAKQDEHYALVPAAVAEKIQQRQSDSIIVLNVKQQQVNEDDPYADYQIPDDLMW